MADIIVNVGEVQLRTCKLTKSILQQMQDLDTQQFLAAKRKHEEGQGVFEVIGWINGVALKREHETLLVVKVGEGDYRLFSAHFEKRRQFPQLYIV